MWDSLLSLVFSLVAWFESFLGDWGLSIIMITIIFRIIIFPITIKQSASTFKMNKAQPLIQELKLKYPNDQQKQAEETQKIYREVGFNPLTGCLPMILQMPIFIILFQVLNSLYTRVDENTVVSFYGIIPDLSLNPVEAFNQSGILFALPYFIMVAIFAVSIVIPAIINKQTNDKTQLMTMIFMAIFMIWVGCMSPAGVVLYWDVSSVIGIATTLVMNKRLKRKDELAEAAKPVTANVSVARKTKKPRPTKKSKR